MNIPRPANENFSYVPSSATSWYVPTPRVRSDRLWRGLEQSPPIQPGWKLWLHRFGVVSFFAVALFLAVH